ncbi:carbohydrate ABC transporter permease [Sedimentibacter sp. MB31-C6]|uniref:carbohydrate ABC transporter permease n=1 Tax=Sedimentibacter sp. MB31-C6 TaxID=3109366 RepID=UPI002DDCDFD4|nr:carbohydrate ABC transporter permease [Sedimentibacter sp. MB36-C1]WSI03681.1 carbohydrate ABC transporter permease [Sedimentibacter sp. MB36-C1]
MSIQKLNKIVCYTILILLSILCLFSFYLLIVNSTRVHSQIQKGFSFLLGGNFKANLNNVLNNKDLPVIKGIINSLIVSAATAALATYFSVLTAFSIHTYDFKYKKLAFTFIMMIMMIPPQVYALGFVRWMGKLNLMDSLIPLFLPSVASPIVFYFMLSYMQSNLPKAVVEAARMDGASEFRTFNQIVIPIMKPAIAVQAIFTFVSAWNNYFIPSLIIRSAENKTLPILVAQLRSADYLKFDMGQVYMLVFLAIIPIIIIYIILSKYIVRGVAVGSVKE